MSTIQYIALGLAVFALLFLLASIRSARRGQIASVATNLALSLCLAFMGGIFGLGAVSLRGYEAFTHEQLAATITVEPKTEGQFNAMVKHPDGTVKNYLLNGEQLLIDAYILKWPPIMNMLGWHTHFQLARITGRYFDINDEQNKPHTVYPLHEESKLNLFNLSQQFGIFKDFVDAEYGSASFVPAQEKQTFVLMVSTSGLLFRRLAD